METNRVAEKLSTDNTSVRRLQGESINFKCIIEPSQPNQVRKAQIRWRFSKNGEKFTKLPDGVRNISGDEIAIERINKTHRGYYRCSLNTVSFSALLRVKGLFYLLIYFFTKKFLCIFIRSISSTLAISWYCYYCSYISYYYINL
jgi:hypothetical protein